MPKTDYIFAYEDQLCAVLARHSHGALLPTHRVQSIAQQQVGSVIADLVLFAFPNRPPDSMGSIPDFTYLEAAVVSSLMTFKSSQTAQIARRLNTSAHRLRRHIESLHR